MAAAGLLLTRLALSDYRNYAALTWRPGARLVVIHGPNGSGKTNLLESLSMLVPGRGLRGARNADLARRGEGASGRWGVAARLDTPAGPLDLATGSPPDGPADRRTFRLDGDSPRNQAEIASRLATVWLTPQMDRLFMEGPSGRRRFLDRLVFALEPSHAREVASHDAAMAQRNRLLAEHCGDASWLAGLEDTMARHGVAATAGRIGLADQLNAALAAGAAGAFPQARLGLECPIADGLAEQPALAVEEWLRGKLADSRARDAASGTAAVGAHRADMTLSDAATGLRAGDASTGQQKALLIGVVLGHAAALAEFRGFAPLLLLDEPVVHLDAARRDALFAALRSLPAQAILTGTDPEAFAPLERHAAAFLAGAGTLRPDARFGCYDAESESVALS